MTGRAAFLVVAGVLAGCSDVGPHASGDPVDAFLASVCVAAAQCPGVSVTPADLAACPAGIRSDLSVSQVAELATFGGYPASKQNCVLGCVASEICGRFGGSLANISDTDVLEPFRFCSSNCGASGSTFSLWTTGVGRVQCTRQLEPDEAT